MRHSTSIEDIEAKIERLERVQAEQLAELKNSASALLKSLSPGNTIKNILAELVISPETKKYLLDVGLGIGAGVIGKKLFVNHSNTIFKKITGSALQGFITNFVSKKLHKLRAKNKEEHPGT